MIIVYSTSTCPHCITLKKRLSDNNIPFAVFDNEEYMEHVLGIDEIPVIGLEDGTMLSYIESMQWMKEQEVKH